MDVKEEKKIQDRKENIKNWLKNPHNLALVGIVIFAFLIRLYYFIQTSGQTLWWDEAEYGSTAKNWALDTPYDYNPQRPPLFQFIWSLLISSGLQENAIKFFITVIPAVFLVFTIYLLGREMFSKEIGLIAAFLSSVSWTLVFWASRIQPDFISMSFQVLSIFFMWKHWKKTSAKFVFLAAFFAGLGFYFKVSALLVPMIFIVFLLIKERFGAFTNKHNYYFAFIFLLTLAPYFIWSQLTFDNPLGFRVGYVDAPTDFPIGWYNLRFYHFLTEGLLFILFIVGVLLAFRFLLYFDLMIKEKQRCFDPKLFSLISLAFISVFYIFYIRNTDDRWVFLWLPFIFYIIGLAVMFVYEFLKKYKRTIAIIISVGLIAFSGYEQLTHANSLIDLKKDSYMPVKLGGEWIKENSEINDKLLSISYTQSVYYSERNVSTYATIKNNSEFDNYLDGNKPRFLQVSMFEPHPPWVNDWINKNGEKLRPVQAYFADAEKKQPVLIIYEINY